jgi:hypothetical protein
MCAKIKSAALGPGLEVTDSLPSMEKMKTILAQIHLLTALEEISDLRKTMRLQAVALDELRQTPVLPPAVVTELLATVQRRDRKFSSRLARLRHNVSKASKFLTPPAEEVEKK